MKIAARVVLGTAVLGLTVAACGSDPGDTSQGDAASSSSTGGGSGGGSSSGGTDAAADGALPVDASLDGGDANVLDAHDAAIHAPGYYVSPTGSDSNDGLSRAKPFMTLERAQSAMRASTTFKTTYLMDGKFQRAAVLTLGSTDAGESWLADPGAVPVLDGQGATAEAFSVGTSGVQIRWLTIQNFTDIGVLASGATHMVIDSNTIQDIHCTGWNQGGVVLVGSIADVEVTHNLVQRSGYAGIMAANSQGNTRSNVSFSYNAIYDTCTTVADCGALYADDRNHSATGTVFSNNVVGNFGSPTNGTKGIYLDDEESNVAVENNIVYGTGQWALQIHGGDHNTVQNNIFDISGAAKLGLYQDDGASAPEYGMAGNTLKCNIVYSSAARTSPLWDYSVTSGSGSPQATDVPPTITNNLYWLAGGAAPSEGPIVSGTETLTIGDPHFTNPAGNNYAFQSSPPAFCATFAPIDTSAVGPLPNP